MSPPGRDRGQEEKSGTEVVEEDEEDREKAEGVGQSFPPAGQSHRGLEVYPTFTGEEGVG